MRLALLSVNDIVEFWQQNYAGMENPGPDHVRRELADIEIQLCTT